MFRNLTLSTRVGGALSTLVTAYGVVSSKLRLTISVIGMILSEK